MNKVLKVLKFLLKSFILMGMVGLLVVSLFISNILKTTPKITEDMLLKATVNSTNIYDKDGNLLYEELRDRRDYLTLDKYPQAYLDYVIVTEDKEYYESPGYSVKGLTNAAISLAKEKILKEGVARGGSTLEQQLIKNLVFSSLLKDKTIDRKIKELWLSVQLNKNFSKDKILEWYVNLIYLGEGSYGANTIAITYFGKSISEMQDRTPENLSKLALIAGLGQSPSAYNLYDNPEAVEERRNIILNIALENGKLTQEEYDLAKQVPIQDGLQERNWRSTANISRVTQHSAFISSVFSQIKDLGYDIEQTPMQIYTTLDQGINSKVKEIFDTYWGYQDGQQIAGTFIDPTTGFVLAQYGGLNSEAFGLNRATQQNRSSGSSIKPFLSYGPAIEYLGLGTENTLDSSPYVYPGTNFVANNYGGAVYGHISMARALKLSLNTPAIRLLDQSIGSNIAKSFLGKMGLDVKDYYGGQDALGLNVSTEQMAGAFATLSSLGEYKKPQYIQRIIFEDNSEKHIEFIPIRAMNASTAYVLLHMLKEVPKPDGTAIHAQLPYVGYAAKTGSVGYDNSIIWTPDLSTSDSWIAGTTKHVAGAIWTGYDNPYEPNSWIWEYNKSHQELFRIIMETLNQDKDTSDWTRPNTVIYRNGLSISDVKTSETGAFDTAVYVDNTNSEILESISRVTDTKDLLDGGTPSYVIPSNADEVLKWRDSVDTNVLQKWANNPGSGFYALQLDENFAYEQP